MGSTCQENSRKNGESNTSIDKNNHVYLGSNICEKTTGVFCSCAASHHLWVYRLACPFRYKRCQKGATEKLGIIQNKCLRVVSGAYRATPVEVLHAETATLPMQEYLDLLQIKARSYLRLGGQAAFLKKQCKQVAAKLCQRAISGHT